MIGARRLFATQASGASDITPDHMWLDASVTASIATGVSTATRVTSWADQAGSFDVSNSLGNTCPIYDGAFGSSTLNGYLIPLFAAGDYLFRTSGVMSSLLGGMSVYAVIGNVGATTIGWFAGDGSSTNNAPIVGIRQEIPSNASTRNFCFYARNNTSTETVSVADTDINVPASGFAIYTLTMGASSVESFLDGTNPGTGTNPQTYTASGTTTTDRFAIGLLLRSVVGLPMSGFEIAEFRVYASEHDAADISTVVSALQSKWGL